MKRKKKKIKKIKKIYMNRRREEEEDLPIHHCVLLDHNKKRNPNQI